MLWQDHVQKQNTGQLHLLRIKKIGIEINLSCV